MPEDDDEDDDKELGEEEIEEEEEEEDEDDKEEDRTDSSIKVRSFCGCMASMTLSPNFPVSCFIYLCPMQFCCCLVFFNSYLWNDLFFCRYLPLHLLGRQMPPHSSAFRPQTNY